MSITVFIKIEEHRIYKINRRRELPGASSLSKKCFRDVYGTVMLTVPTRMLPINSDLSLCLSRFMVLTMAYRHSGHSCRTHNYCFQKLFFPLWMKQGVKLCKRKV